MTMQSFNTAVCFGIVAMGIASSAQAAGLLVAPGATQSLRIVDHHVEVQIVGTAAKTEIVQTFANPGEQVAEAVYAFPLPKGASLAELAVTSGDLTIQGEVVANDQANGLYQNAKNRGDTAALVTAKAHDGLELRVAPLKPGADVMVRLVYYQWLELDAGVGRYAYPLEDGPFGEASTEGAATNAQVEDTLSVRWQLDSEWPVRELRVPGYEELVTVTRPSKHRFVAELVDAHADLSRDLVFYYRLVDDLPGRVELLAHRDRTDAPGTFMLVVTPGIDLQPLAEGADYLFIVDTSGSMAQKLASTADAVERALRSLHARDRYRIITFNHEAHELSDGWQTPQTETLDELSRTLGRLVASGKTNLYGALQLGFAGLDPLRATNLVLLTDGVTNVGTIKPDAIRRLVARYDVRIFGFLIGNQTNWPLMQLLAQVSGGSYTNVSTSDDIIGQLMLAKSKLGSQALRDLQVSFSGGAVEAMTDVPKKLFRGQQLVLLGRYQQSGEVTLTLRARVTNQTLSYTTSFVFPEIERAHAELERLWAKQQMDRLVFAREIGALGADVAANGLRELGVRYQLVGDETSMVAVRDEIFAQHGIARSNLLRVKQEAASTATPTPSSAPSARVDQDRPMFKGNSSVRLGAGALTLTDLFAMGGCLGLMHLLQRWAAFKRRLS